MGKKKFITTVTCIVFIVFSGILYLKQGTGGTDASFINETGSAMETADAGSGILQEEEAGDRQEAEYGSSAQAATNGIAVYICGAVKHPGVYSLPDGQRICDAIDAAGGFKKSAARSAINLAKVLSDGEQVVVPTKKQAASYKDNNIGNAENGGDVAGTKAGAAGLVNINTASREELMSLPGIGESKADAVIEYRLSNSFKSIMDIKNVTGIKDGVFNQIKDLITV